MEEFHLLSGSCVFLAGLTQSGNSCELCGRGLDGIVAFTGNFVSFWDSGRRVEISFIFSST